jgi:hypothetical protein
MKAKLFGKKIEREGKKQDSQMKIENYEFHRLPQDVSPGIYDGLSELERYAVTGVANCDLLDENGVLLQKHATGKHHFNYIAYLSLNQIDEGREILTKAFEKLKKGLAEVHLGKKDRQIYKFDSDRKVLSFDEFMNLYHARKARKDPQDKNLAGVADKFMRDLKAIAFRGLTTSYLASPDGLWHSLETKGKILKQKLLKTTNYRASLEDSVIANGNGTLAQAVINPAYLVAPEHSLVTELTPEQIGRILAGNIEYSLEDDPDGGIWLQGVVDEEKKNLSLESSALILYEFLEKQFGLNLEKQKKEDYSNPPLSTESKELVTENLRYLEKYDSQAAQEIRKKLEGTK